MTILSTQITSAATRVSGLYSRNHHATFGLLVGLYPAEFETLSASNHDKKRNKNLREKYDKLSMN